MTKTENEKYSYRVTRKQWQNFLASRDKSEKKMNPYELFKDIINSSYGLKREVVNIIIV